MLLPINTLKAKATPETTSTKYDHDHASAEQSAQQHEEVRPKNLDDEDNNNTTQHRSSTSSETSGSYCAPPPVVLLGSAKHQQETGNTTAACMSNNFQRKCFKIGDSSSKQEAYAEEDKKQQEQGKNATKNPHKKSSTIDQTTSISLQSKISTTIDNLKAIAPCTNNSAGASDGADKKSNKKSLIIPMMTVIIPTTGGEEYGQHEYTRQSERKRSREQKRRQNISAAINRLTTTLLKVDHSNLVQHNNHTYFGEESITRNKRLRIVGGIPTFHQNQPLNRTEIINHATFLIEKLALENEESKSKLYQVHHHLTNTMITSCATPTIANINTGVEEVTRSCTAPSVLNGNHFTPYFLQQVSPIVLSHYHHPLCSLSLSYNVFERLCDNSLHLTQIIKLKMFII